MAKLSQATIRLLDRLFNLKGEENTIIKRIEDEISTTESEIENTTQARNKNEVEKNELQSKLTIFTTQAESFKSAFEGIDDATFSSLREIGIDFEISKMLNTIEEKAPEYIETLSNEIDEVGQRIEENKSSLNDLSNSLTSLNNEKSKEEENRLKLISLLEQSLSTSEIEREVLTVNFVKKILSLFNTFDEQEIKDLTKIIMFPDDGLFDYANNYEERLANGEINLDQEVTEEPEVEEPTKELEVSTEEVEEPVEESSIEEISIPEEVEEKEENSEEVSTEEEPTEESKSTTEMYQEVEPVTEEENIDIVPEENKEIDLTSLNMNEDTTEVEQETETTDEEANDEDETTILPIIEPDNNVVEKSIEEFLEEKGLSIQKFAEINDTPVSEIMAYLNEIDRDLIERNYEVLRSINANEKDIYLYSNNMLYIADNDLNNKLTSLRAKGINDKTILKLLEEPKGCFRISYSDFQDRIRAIELIDDKLNEENAHLMNYSVEQFAENLSLLNDAGYDLSPEEKRNFSCVLASCRHGKEIIEILKNYLLSITRKNGKYALGIFWQEPYNLLTSIDDLIEYNLESLITTHPEVLATNCVNLMKRVKYCEEKGIPVLEEGTNTTYYDYILNPSKFIEKFGNVELPSLPNRDEVNQMLPELLSNKDNISQIHNLFDTLKEYYENTTLYETPELTGKVEEKYHNIIQKLTNEMHAELVGKNTYNLKGIYISKNKLERHLAILISSLNDNLETIDNMDTELILASSLYNNRQSEETLKTLIVDTIGNTTGGME